MSTSVSDAFGMMALCLLAAGSALIAAELRWFRRRSLPLRLGPYAPARTSGLGAGSQQTRSGVLVPLVIGAGNRLATAMGVKEPLELRLRRAGVSLDPAQFRLRQFAVGLVCALGAIAGAITLGTSAAVSLLLVLGTPALGCLLLEHRLDARIAARRGELAAAMPVVAEQLGLLIGAGHSLRSALTRLSKRASGAVACDLTEVVRGVRQGLSEVEALDRWAETSGLAGVERLVGVLALHREAGDLAALIAQEAAAMRSEAHRDLIEAIERRNQLVWVPVTVATLVPGLILLAVPFLGAMTRVTGG